MLRLLSAIAIALSFNVSMADDHAAAEDAHATTGAATTGDAKVEGEKTGHATTGDANAAHGEGHKGAKMAKKGQKKK